MPDEGRTSAGQKSDKKADKSAEQLGEVHRLVGRSSLLGHDGCFYSGLGSSLAQILGPPARRN